MSVNTLHLVFDDLVDTLQLEKFTITRIEKTKNTVRLNANLSKKDVNELRKTLETQANRGIRLIHLNNKTISYLLELQFDEFDYMNRSHISKLLNNTYSLAVVFYLYKGNNYKHTHNWLIIEIALIRSFFVNLLLNPKKTITGIHTKLFKLKTLKLFQPDIIPIVLYTVNINDRQYV